MVVIRTNHHFGDANILLTLSTSQLPPEDYLPRINFSLKREKKSWIPQAHLPRKGNQLSTLALHKSLRLEAAYQGNEFLTIFLHILLLLLPIELGILIVSPLQQIDIVVLAIEAFVAFPQSGKSSIELPQFCKLRYVLTVNSFEAVSLPRTSFW